ncbi:MAG TPA: hypothetical protein VIJ85_03770 [Rhizomicrobium sp.]
MEILPGRECGGCTICCSELHIDAPELKKLAGVRCVNCSADNSCAIYDTRPQTCRDFHCAWRVMDVLDDDWRPDKSGILLMPQTKGIPPAYRGKDGVQIFMVRRDAIYKREFPGLLAAWVSARVPIFLTIPAPIGFAAPNCFLNDLLEDVVRRQDRDGLLRVLRTTIQKLAREKAMPMTFSSGEPN